MITSIKKQGFPNSDELKCKAKYESSIKEILRSDEQILLTQSLRIWRPS